MVSVPQLETNMGCEWGSEGSNPDAALCGRGHTAGASLSCSDLAACSHRAGLACAAHGWYARVLWLTRHHNRAGWVSRASDTLRVEHLHGAGALRGLTDDALLATLVLVITHQHVEDLPKFLRNAHSHRHQQRTHHDMHGHKGQTDGRDDHQHDSQRRIGGEQVR